MRIISGKFKGKKIQYLKSNITRPLKDSVKESIFNILTHSKEINIKINEANILDLYSGVGSFGLECLSRGAREVTFFENNNEALRILNINIKALSLINKVKIENGKILSIKKLTLSKDKFKIFFLDPPFADKEFVKILKIIKKKEIFNSNHIVIIHREKNSEDELENLLKILSIRNYGRSKIIFGKFI